MGEGDQPPILVIACGALAHELQEIICLNRWTHLAVQCLPANLHSRPEKIPERIRAKIQANRGLFSAIFVAYADCGTGGRLDAVLREENVERLAGAHCYEFFSGSALFSALHQAEPATFYLTDFLARHFERLVMEELGINKHPELLETYFSNYLRVVYLSQNPSKQVLQMARAAAKRLGLEFQQVVTGYGDLQQELAAFINEQSTTTGEP